MNEFELIKSLISEQKVEFPNKDLGPGDDAALISIPKNKKILASKDLLVEGVHFDFSYTLPQDVGWKAIAVNASDIYAMGGKLAGFLVGLAMPKDRIGLAKDLYQGMYEYLEKVDVPIYGGDISRSDKLVLSITALGFVDDPILRSGARVGDLVLVSGKLGYSKLGLEILQKNKNFSIVTSSILDTEKQKAVSLHLRPEISNEIPSFLSKNIKVNSMIDVSDGFFQDLNHILEASGVSAIVNIDKVPSVISREVDSKYHFELISGGEDYQLIFTIPKLELEKVLFKFPFIKCVGEICEKKEENIYIIDNQDLSKEELTLDQYARQLGIKKSFGFDHFRAS